MSEPGAGVSAVAAASDGTDRFDETASEGTRGRSPRGLTLNVPGVAELGTPLAATPASAAGLWPQNLSLPRLTESASLLLLDFGFAGAAGAFRRERSGLPNESRVTWTLPGATGGTTPPPVPGTRSEPTLSPGVFCGRNSLSQAGSGLASLALSGVTTSGVTMITSSDFERF